MVTMIVESVKNDDQERVEKVREKQPGRARSDPTMTMTLRSVNIWYTSPLGRESSKLVSMTLGIMLPHSPRVL